MPNTPNSFSFLTPKVVFGGMLAIIIGLGGLLLTPILTLSTPTVKLLITEAVKCSADATTNEMQKLKLEKLDVDTYIADQRRVSENDEKITESISRLDTKIDWLIKIHVSGVGASK